MEKDYYKILGVDKTATISEIKAEYRKLCKIHHPDKGGDENKFKEISEAYEILSNEEKKSQYDRFGSVGNNSNGNPFNMDDIFSQFGNMFGQQRRGTQHKKGSDLRVNITVNLKDIIFAQNEL